jgi:hypothetical protein
MYLYQVKKKFIPSESTILVLSKNVNFILIYVDNLTIIDYELEEFN